MYRPTVYRPSWPPRT